MNSDVNSHNPAIWGIQITQSVMLRAVQDGHVEIITALIETGTNANARLTDGNTFLITAVKSGQTESVKALIRGGADVSARGFDGMSPLNVASVLGLTNIVRILLDNGADIENRDNDLSLIHI